MEKWYMIIKKDPFTMKKQWAMAGEIFLKFRVRIGLPNIDE